MKKEEKKVEQEPLSPLPDEEPVLEAAPAEPVEEPVQEDADSLPLEETSLESSEEIKHRKKKKRLKISEVDELHDIRYKGPLSYRYLRIIGWLCMCVLPLTIVFSLAKTMKVPGAENLQTFNDIAGSITGIAMPLFLLANFSLILRSHANFKKNLITYAALSLILAVVYYLAAYRYLFALFNYLFRDAASTHELIQTLGTVLLGKGFNVFFDLLLCTLFFFFINYVPKKFFTGKKIYIFRFLSLIIVAYEIFSFLVKLFAAYGYFTIPTILVPLLASKSFSMFLLFVAITLFIKARERIYIRLGGQKENYGKFLKSNVNSFSVSLFITIACLICAGIEFLIMLFTLLGAKGIAESQTAMPVEDMYNLLVQSLDAFGIGNGLTLVYLAPIAMLFSYTRTHKNPGADIFVPIGGIALMVFIVIEGGYWVMTLAAKAG